MKLLQGKPNTKEYALRIIQTHLSAIRLNKGKGFGIETLYQTYGATNLQQVLNNIMAGMFFIRQ